MMNAEWLGYHFVSFVHSVSSLDLFQMHVLVLHEYLSFID